MRVGDRVLHGPTQVWCTAAMVDESRGVWAALESIEYCEMQLADVEAEVACDDQRHGQLIRVLAWKRGVAVIDTDPRRVRAREIVRDRESELWQSIDER